MKYFTFKELVYSDTAKIKNIDNTPTWDDIDKLKDLVKYVLDPLRELYGKPVYVSSGYRSEELNEAVNGSKTSDHKRGCAADITAGSKESNKILFELIKDNLEYRQLIDECDYTWIHVSYDSKDNKKQMLHLK